MSSVASALPLALVRHPPFTDLPEHVAAIATLARLLPGGGGAPYVIALGSSQYFLYHLAGAVMTRLLGDALLANGILLAILAMLWPLSLRTLLRALGRDERLAVFGAMLVYNRALVIGFLPFFASVPVTLFAMAALVRFLRAPSLARGVALATLTLALFYTHVSLLAPFALTALVMTALRITGEVRRVRLVMAVGLALLPTAIVAVAWWRMGALSGQGGQIERVTRLPLGMSIGSLPVWTFDIWHSHVDEACAVVWWTSFVVVLAVGLRREVTAAGVFAAIPFACTVVVFLATPHYLGLTGFLNVRLAPVLVLLALLGLAPQKGRVGDVPLVLAAVAALVMAANAAFEMRRIEYEQLGDLDALLAHARPGSRLAMLNFETTSRRVPFWPYVFAGSYHRAQGGLVAGYSFTEMAHWPVHYAPGAGPPVHNPFWVYTPCAYRYRSDGDYYDYVLVQGRFEPFADDVPGPHFSPIARTRAFTLYEKMAGASDDVTPDRGPCRGSADAVGGYDSPK